MANFKVNDIGLFDDAVSYNQTFSSEIDSLTGTINSSDFSDNKGPIAENIKDALKICKSDWITMNDHIKNDASLYVEIQNTYQTSDKDVEKNITSVGESSVNNTPNTPSTAKSNKEIANEVIDGKWGNSEERKRKLEEAGYDYDEIQNIVNNKVSGATPSASSNTKIVNEVIDGKWGNDEERKRKLEEAGYDYQEIQSEVNDKLS